jgi:hypothetical protein
VRGVGHDSGVPYTYENIQGNAINCRSWLASEGVFMGAARLKAAFAGKPAPSGDRENHGFCDQA